MNTPRITHCGIYESCGSKRLYARYDDGTEEDRPPSHAELYLERELSAANALGENLHAKWRETEARLEAAEKERDNAHGLLLAERQRWHEAVERAELAEASAAKAREDAERLDALEARRNHTQFPELGRKNIVVVECEEGQSLRAAIDAALRGGKDGGAG